MIDIINIALEAITRFFSEAFPSWRQIIYYTLPLWLFTWGSGWFAGYLRIRKSLKVAYTRKVFHFLIFTMAGVLHIFTHISLVALFGGVVVIYVGIGIVKAEGYPFYEAVARPGDSPHKRLFVFVPLLTTAIGGVTSNILFPQFAYIGYLVSGWGDAIAEPVGERWGKHPYKVPSMAGVSANRTIEGSIAVLLAGALGAFVALILTGMDVSIALQMALACGAIGALVESVSTHGIDNFTVQVAVAAAAHYVFLFL